MGHQIVQGQDPDDLVGMSWDNISKQLVGIMPDGVGGLQVRMLDPETGKYTVKTVDQGSTATPFPNLGGNIGSANAFRNGIMAAQVLNPSSGGGVHLALIDTANAILLSSPPIEKVGLGLVEQMAWA